MRLVIFYVAGHTHNEVRSTLLGKPSYRAISMRHQSIWLLLTRLEDLGDNSIEEKAPTVIPEKAQRDRMADKWKNVLRFIGKEKTHLHAVIEYVHKNKLDITDENIRSQLAGYVTTGLLNRVERGVYELTETGVERIGYDAN